MLGKLGPHPGQRIDWSSPFSRRLLAAYAFNEGGGTRLRCSVHPGQSGTISGATWVATPYGPALDFAAGTNAVTCPQDGRLAGMRRLTVAMVLQLDGGGGGGFGRAVTLNDTATYGILTDGGTGSSLLGATNSSNFASGTPMGTAWRHVAITYDGSTRRIYFDGILQASSVGALAINSSTADLIIGNRTGLDRGWDGRIKQLLIYDRDYTAGEVARLAQDWWLPWEDRRFRYWIWAQGGGNAYTLTAEAGSYTLTGGAAGARAARRMVGGAGAYTLTGGAATPRAARKLAANAGSYTLTGQSAGLRASRRITADAGAFSVTGGAAALRAARRIAAAAGGYTLAGQDATLAYSGAGAKILDAATGVYTVTGGAATLRVTRRLQADTGVYVLTGGPATLALVGAVEGPTQVTTTLSATGAASSVLAAVGATRSVIVQAGPSSTTFGAA